jgi:hypothetical protein
VLSVARAEYSSTLFEQINGTLKSLSGMTVKYRRPPPACPLHCRCGNQPHRKENDMVRRDDGRSGRRVTGWKNKIETTIASVTPAGVLAEQHRKMAEPGSGKKK